MNAISIRNWFLSLLVLVLIPRAVGQTTAFTYQGSLAEKGAPANGSYDLQFALRDAATGGNTVGSAVTVDPVPIAKGLFTATLDFGSGAFNGTARWLEIGVRADGSGAPYTVLSPRQPLNAVPMALFALTPAGPQGPQGRLEPQVQKGRWG